LLVQPQHCDMPLFNTALLHAGKALRLAVQSDLSYAQNLTF
jgi:hypothetical protein